MKHLDQDPMKALSQRYFSKPLCATLSVVAVAAYQCGCSSAFDDLSLAQEDAGTCEHALPLDPPNLVTDQTQSVEFVVAFKAYDMGEIDQFGLTERYRTMGYDLDKTCTGHGQGASCQNEYWKLETPILDGPQGQDNARGAILYRSYRQQGSASATDGVNSAIATGAATTIIRVRGYNKQTLDSQVEVAVFGATMNPRDEAGMLLRPPSQPSWSGDDVWAAAYPWWIDNDENDQPSTEHPRYYDPNAYVTDSILVAHLEHYEVPTLVHMSQVVITARIVRNDDGGWALTEGIFTGRAKSDNFLIGLEYIRDPNLDSHPYICKGTMNYQLYKEFNCAAADLTFEPSSDPNAPCDATSWAWKFEAQPAKLSGTGTAKLDPNCEPELSPRTDSCAIED